MCVKGENVRVELFELHLPVRLLLRGGLLLGCLCRSELDTSELVHAREDGRCDSEGPAPSCIGVDSRDALLVKDLDLCRVELRAKTIGDTARKSSMQNKH